jgi:sulfur-oxidizing protein SoxY
MDMTGATRRDVMTSGASLATLILVRPAGAADAMMQAAIRGFIGEAQVREGRVKLDVSPLVENGNSVPLSVIVESPMSAEDHVKVISVFNQKNPQPNVVTFHLGPRSGRASVSTRIRLADSQRVTAIAQMSDGSFWSDTADVVVTLAACVEGL